VGNALVHTEPEVAVMLRVERVDGLVAFDVEDAGQGMPPDVAERATERFYRADPARSRHRGGSGLGLSIVDAAVAAHGGSVAIDSESDRGTTVRLAFPAASVDSAPVVAAPADSPPTDHERLDIAT
jgi:two-component system OmpR family sensor kinase